MRYFWIKCQTFSRQTPKSACTLESKIPESKTYLVLDSVIRFSEFAEFVAWRRALLILSALLFRKV
ncbi:MULTISPECIES: hypothetical protein [unclassified Helicobacter]|uniref:hypothetical protein n=1 Tax=unclassified Helicobacter TaxID=2593540 RepID=UPI00115FDED9|nr:MULTISPECIES: hypothetical protein [unclassified Helicobacter]